MGGHPDVEARIAADGLVPPIVVVDGAVLSAGGKLNVSAIERAVAAALEGMAHPWLTRPPFPPTDDALLAPPDAACCAGACGPIFETPLLEQLFNRIRGAVSGRAQLRHPRHRPPGTGRRRMDHR